MSQSQKSVDKGGIEPQRDFLANAAAALPGLLTHGASTNAAAGVSFGFRGAYSQVSDATDCSAGYIQRFHATRLSSLFGRTIALPYPFRTGAPFPTLPVKEGVAVRIFYFCFKILHFIALQKSC